MIAVYAMGEGLGHLTRVRAAAHTLAVDDADLVLLTDSRFATDPRVVGRATVRPAPPGARADAEALAEWVRRELAELAPDELWIDAFPAGIRGELGAALVPASVTRTVHLARLLRWDRYQPTIGAAGTGAPPALDHVWMVEDLHAPHRRWLESRAAQVAPLELADPPMPSAPGAPPVGPAEAAPGRWLVAHAGPPDEVAELIAFATECAAAEGADAPIVVATPEPVAGFERLDVYPIEPRLHPTDVVVTAAGFNAVRQNATRRRAGRHRFLPFPRRFDDQFERARRAAAMPPGEPDDL